MDFTINEELKNQKILTEILQNKFTNVDNSFMKWKFNDQDID